jgi:hypothetical protein
MSASRQPDHASKSAQEQALLGGLLIAIGGGVAAANLLPDAGRYVVLGIGLVPLAAFFVTRWDWALIWGGIQSGAGAGIVLVESTGDGQGGLFLLSLAAGFGLVSLLATAYGLREHRLWPLVPGGILAVLGGAELAGVGDTLDLIFTYGWPVGLVGAGAILIGRAVLARRSNTE